MTTNLSSGDQELVKPIPRIVHPEGLGPAQAAIHGTMEIRTFPDSLPSFATSATGTRLRLDCAGWKVIFHDLRHVPVYRRALRTTGASVVVGLTNSGRRTDKFVVIPSLGHATLLNLQAGQRSGFFSDLFSTKGALASAAFRAWSPDGKTLAVVISSGYMRDGSLDVLRLGPAIHRPTTLKDSYVATMRKYDSWNAGELLGSPRMDLTTSKLIPACKMIRPFTARSAEVASTVPNFLRLGTTHFGQEH